MPTSVTGLSIDRSFQMLRRSRQICACDLIRAIALLNPAAGRDDPATAVMPRESMSLPTVTAAMPPSKLASQGAAAASTCADVTLIAVMMSWASVSVTRRCSVPLGAVYVPVEL